MVSGDSVQILTKTFSSREVYQLKEMHGTATESTYDILLRLTKKTLNCDYDWVDEISNGKGWKGQKEGGARAGLGSFVDSYGISYRTYENGKREGFQIALLLDDVQYQYERRNGEIDGLWTKWST